ncbi:MAG: glycerophosphodiester phosphodiesterase family protein [Bacteroidales bacterium]|nr:glycerophosphodiester phosphodiesterase family protein [Bacteroidales bacterium]
MKAFRKKYGKGYPVIPAAVVLFAGILLLAFSGNVSAQSTLNVIKVKRAKDCHRFFQYAGKDIPIISGHRGGAIRGFPENSIECFENVLKHTPAFFEIDPRLTRDSVAVLMHDATLERTSGGTGKVSDYTWAELQQFRLKDSEGNLTDFRIPTLEAVIEWARGKTILNLDRKDVPPEVTAALIKRMKAEAFVMITVHNPEQAMFYHREIPSVTFSAHVLTKEAFHAYDKAGFPWKQSIVYIGPKVKPENRELYGLIHARGATCMISAAPTYDRLENAAERKQAYIDVFNDGADILESDLPIEVGEAVKAIMPAKAKKKKYFGTMMVK